MSRAGLAILLVCSFVASALTIAATSLPAGAVPATPQTYFSSPIGNPDAITFDSAGNLYLGNVNGNSITVLPKTSGTIFGQSVTAGRVVTLINGTKLNEPTDLTFDSAGDLFIANVGNNTIAVLPQATGVLFGQPVTADQLTTLTPASGLDGPFSLALDASGDLFIANLFNNSISVLPQVNGTLFGQVVTADQVATLNALAGVSVPASVAFDAAGNLYVASGNAILVLPQANGTLFGQTVVANQAVPLAGVSGLNSPVDLTFDSAGNLFVANEGNNAVVVLPQANGTLFGQTVTADVSVAVTAATGLNADYSIAFDSDGNLFASNSVLNSVTVVPKANDTVFGQSVTADVAATLADTTSLDQPKQMAFDSAGNLFIANEESNSITVLPKSSGTIFGQLVVAGQMNTLTATTGLNRPVGLAFDPAGNLYILNSVLDTASSTYISTVSVLPVASGTIFGQPVVANQVTDLAVTTGEFADYSIALDSDGNLYIGGVSTISVLPQANGTIFGKSVMANTLSTVATGLTGLAGLAFDTAGNLFYTRQLAGFVGVLPVASGTIFGKTVTANDVMTIATGLSQPAGLAFDPAGNLYVASVNENLIAVLAQANGSAFGNSLVADSLSTIVTGPNGSIDNPVFDSAGNLYWNSTSQTIDTLIAPVSVAPVATPHLPYDQPVSEALTASAGVGPYTFAVTAGSLPSGLTLSSGGVLSGTPTVPGQLSTFTVTATDQAGNSGSRMYIFTVAKAPQTITFVNHPPSVADAPGTYTLDATASSGLPVSFSTAAMSTCMVSGDTVTFTGIGTCTILANQAGSAQYLAAPQESAGITVVAKTTLVPGKLSVVGSAPNESLSFSATLTSQANNQGIAGQRVTFSVGALTLCSGTTNTLGVVTCTAPALAALVLLFFPVYTVTYAGSTDYVASSAKGVSYVL